MTIPQTWLPRYEFKPTFFRANIRCGFVFYSLLNQYIKINVTKATFMFRDIPKEHIKNKINFINTTSNLIAKAMYVKWQTTSDKIIKSCKRDFTTNIYSCLGVLIDKFRLFQNFSIYLNAFFKKFYNFLKCVFHSILQLIFADVQCTPLHL